jgi:hypothetical protein
MQRILSPMCRKESVLTEIMKKKELFYPIHL